MYTSIRALHDSNSVKCGETRNRRNKDNFYDRCRSFQDSTCISGRCVTFMRYTVFYPRDDINTLLITLSPLHVENEKWQSYQTTEE